MPYVWLTDPFAAARNIVTAEGDGGLGGAAGLAGTAVWIVDGLHYLVDLDAHLGVTPGQPVLGYPTQPADLAHAR